MPGGDTTTKGTEPERTPELGGGDLSLLVGVPLFALLQELSPGALNLLPELALDGLAVLQGQRPRRCGRAAWGLGGRREKRLVIAGLNRK